jgi:hypothetical protein
MIIDFELNPGNQNKIILRAMWFVIKHGLLLGGRNCHRSFAVAFPSSSFRIYLLLPFLLSASKPDLGWLTIINLVAGNGGRVMVN